MKHTRRPSLESRLRELLDLPSLPERSLVPREDAEEEAEDTTEAEIEENSPFERFNPTEEDAISREDPKLQEIQNDENSMGIDEKRIEHLKHKLQSQEFTLSLPIASVIIICTVISTCCCTLCLRNRLIGCISALKSEKKVNKYLDIDPEISSLLRKNTKLLPKKLPSLIVPRARSLSQDYTHVGVQNSPQSAEKTVETPPTGCYRCCKKKKKEKEKKRKK